jgi:hypothetical protein
VSRQVLSHEPAVCLTTSQHLLQLCTANKPAHSCNDHRTRRLRQTKGANRHMSLHDFHESFLPTSNHTCSMAVDGSKRRGLDLVAIIGCAVDMLQSPSDCTTFRTVDPTRNVHRAVEIVQREEPATEAERGESVRALEELKGRVPLMSKDNVQSAIDRLIQRVRSSGSLCGGLSGCIHAEGRCPVGVARPCDRSVCKQASGRQWRCSVAAGWR